MAIAHPGTLECPGLLVKSVQQAAAHHDALDRVTPVELAGIHCVRRALRFECQRHLITRSVLHAQERAAQDDSREAFSSP